MGKDCCGFCIIYTPKSAFDDALNQINMMLNGILRFYNQLKELIFLQRVILFARNRCLLPAICRRICNVIHDKFAFASTPVSDRMPRSRETKAALEVNAGVNCLAGVAVLPHRYVAVPLIFLNLPIEVAGIQTTFFLAYLSTIQA